MSDLDEKLRELLPVVTIGMEVDQELAIKINYAPERIKQAFIEAGWNPGTLMLTDDEIQRLAKAKGVHAQSLLTGQEWYDRFISELPKDVVIDYQSESNISFHAGNNHGLRKSREAAKRASVLETE